MEIAVLRIDKLRITENIAAFIRGMEGQTKPHATVRNRKFPVEIGSIITKNAIGDFGRIPNAANPVNIAYDGIVLNAAMIGFNTISTPGNQIINNLSLPAIVLNSVVKRIDSVAGN